MQDNIIAACLLVLIVLALVTYLSYIILKKNKSILMKIVLIIIVLTPPLLVMHNFKWTTFTFILLQSVIYLIYLMIIYLSYLKLKKNASILMKIVLMMIVATPPLLAICSSWFLALVVLGLMVFALLVYERFKVMKTLKQKMIVISTAIAAFLMIFLVYKNKVSLLVGLGLAVAYGFFVILKKSTPRRRKIISMITAGVFLVLFIIHTVLLVGATKNYENSLKKIRDIGLPVTIEEIIMNDPDRKLLPEENAVEIIKPYMEWWQEGTSQKNIENDSVCTKEELTVLDKYLGKEFCNLDKFSEKEISLLESYISKHKGTIELINNMANCKGFYVEIDKADPIRTPIQDLLATRETFEMLCLDIMLKERTNKIEEAISDLKKYNYVNGIMNFRQTGAIIPSMIGTAVNGFNIPMISKIMKNKNLTEKQCKELIELLEKIEKKESKAFPNSLNNERAGMSIVFDTEYKINNKMGGSVTPAGFTSPLYTSSSRLDLKTEIRLLLAKLTGEIYYSYLFKPLRVMEKTMYNEVMFSAIRSSKEKYYIESNINIDIPWYAIISRIIIPELHETAKQVFTERNKYIMLKTELLIQDYKFKTGKFPASLTDIKKVTGYDVPKDIMTGKDFKYEVKGNSYTLESEYKETNGRRRF